MMKKTTNTDIQIIPPITELNSGWTSTQYVHPQILYKDVEEYTVLIERRTEKKCNAIVSLLEVLISTRKTTSTTSWSTLLMICQNFAMSDPNAIHL